MEKQKHLSASPLLLSETNLKPFVEARNALLMAKIHQMNSVTFILCPRLGLTSDRQDVILNKKKNHISDPDTPYVPAGLILDSLKKMGL